MDQLRSDIWCAAFVRRHNDLGNFCVLAQRGDPVAGQIWIEIDHLNGTRTLLTQASSAQIGDSEPGRAFIMRYERADPQKVIERIAREKEFDPDLWVLALESRQSDCGVDVVSP